MLIDRAALHARLALALGRSRAVVLLGPRQSGKTTLAKAFVEPASSRYFDLEDPAVEAQFAAPMSVLSELRGLVVIDEVQHAPDLFKVLRVLIDRRDLPAQFLLLGSASPKLLRQTSESLAGRIEIVEIGGLTLEEVGAERQTQLWWRGGLPPSFTAANDTASRQWRRDYMRTVVERDLRHVGVNAAPPAVFRFWAMLGHCHGQTWNAADPARSLGVNESTVRRYLDWLTQLYLIRQLQPWYENLGKRQVRSPKLYFHDTGLLHEMLGVASAAELQMHPRSGASWEGFALEQVLRVARPDEAYFWATHTGAELDLLMFKDGRRIGVEFKRVDAPQLTPSMRIAAHDLRLDALYVVYPGTKRYRIAEAMQAVPLAALLPADTGAAQR
jgi:predicted AAA+ superfamily ATPase